MSVAGYDSDDVIWPDRVPKEVVIVRRDVIVSPPAFVIADDAVALKRIYAARERIVLNDQYGPAGGGIRLQVRAQPIQCILAKHRYIGGEYAVRDGKGRANGIDISCPCV